MISDRKESMTWLPVRPPLVQMATEEAWVLCQQLDVLFRS